MTLNVEQCQQARLSRDARFDGKFFIAVKTTGIYCRPICPATSPKEENVSYFSTAIEAANDGYRPCLRCRPDSAPGSCAFKGVDTTVERALTLIEQGALATGSVESLASRLGISDRYLRLLFKDKLGTTPKQYALYQQLLFAKQLLHQSKLPITDVAFSSGFNILRRFNDSFKQHFQLTPQQIRKQQQTSANHIELILSYRPPYCWDFLQGFLRKRLIPSLEWIGDKGDERYGRTFTHSDDEGNTLQGDFEVVHLAEKNAFKVKLTTSQPFNILPVVKNIRRMLDLDADVSVIEQQLSQVDGLSSSKLLSGLRLPGIWDPFEAGIRAILGQQISVEAARKLVCQVVECYGESYAQKGDNNNSEHFLFPGPSILSKVDFAILKIPQSRKNTLMAFSRYCEEHPHYDNLDDWLTIKGIGPWTVNYAKMRGQSDTDIWLSSDLGVKKALDLLAADDADEGDGQVDFNSDAAKPWRSYLTFQCWNLLS
ncbi:MAG: AraC family transcriptional regulator of adaptative response / DNA-3-methyladenine glycosylase II [Phenylobacterium sp.]|jgi:AraC family transcriptional regulator of adaptative response / DNA-3-methyladenine glycosylase II